MQLNLRLCASISFSSTHPILMLPFEETLGAMAAMVDAGKVRFIEVNNFSVAQLQEAQTRYPIVSNQVRYNVIDRYRFDARDGLYKVLDINPRIEATFRLFVGERNGRRTGPGPRFRVERQY